jgi:hypothetical protein
MYYVYRKRGEVLVIEAQEKKCMEHLEIDGM